MPDLKIPKSSRPSDPRLEELINLLKPYDPEKIILFGSRARGEADSYSDYDVVVIKTTDRPFLERLQDMVPYQAAEKRLQSSCFSSLRAISVPL
jgi:predicted nucleotidyltransferase